LDATLGEVGGGLHGVAIGHLCHIEFAVLQERREQEIADAGRGRPIEFAGDARALREQSMSDPTFMAAGATMATMVFDTRAIGEIGVVVGSLSCRKGCAVKVEDGVNSSVIVMVPTNALIPTMLSPPGRPLTTTALPSAPPVDRHSRAAMLAPLPGPSGGDEANAAAARSRLGHGMPRRGTPARRRSPRSRDECAS
jgi:hypothetical protein